MMIASKNSPEYREFKLLELWKAIPDIPFLEKKIEPMQKTSVLFAYLCERTKGVYLKLPKRKNGEEALVHPLNVVAYLQQAGIKDEITLCAGMIHDLIEEKIDIYQQENKIKGYNVGLNQLAQYEEEVYAQFKKEITAFCRKKDIQGEIAKQLLMVAKLLTRNKKDFYYKYINRIFHCPDDLARERALQIKLADRTHNVLCIECFNEEERIFQCFKNLFILNNTKRYLMERKGEDLFKAPLSPLEILFKKCGKATYEALLNLGHHCIAKGMGEVKVMLQLAFKKFALERSGVWQVTKADEKEKHLVIIFHDIIRKYDFRLYHKWKKLAIHKEKQLRYVEKFFADYNFNPTVIKAIIDYKDAYALKEVVAYLLYLPNYVLDGFESGNLFKNE